MIDITEYYEDLSDDAKVVADFSLGDKHSSNCWKKLVEMTAGWRNLEQAKEAFTLFEERLLLDLEMKGVDTRDKKGKLSLNKVMKSSTYRSAKSTILQAKEHGVNLFGDSPPLFNKPLPKSVVSKRLTEVKKSKKTDEGPMDLYLAKRQFNRAMGAYASVLPRSDYEELCEYIKKYFS